MRRRPRMTLSNRLGASLQRSPYVWLVVTVLSMLMAASVVGSVIEDEEPRRTWIGWVALAFIGYGVLSSIWLMPRAVARSRREISTEQVALVRWALAIAPFLIGFAPAMASGPQLAFGVGFLASVLLLAVTARSLAASARASQ